MRSSISTFSPDIVHAVSRDSGSVSWNRRGLGAGCVEALGYEIRGGGARIYFAGDTDLFPGMAALTGIDVALLPIGGWGGNEMGEGHLDPERAAEAAALIGPRVAIPIHWGTLLRADLHRRDRDLHGPPAEEFRARMAELAPETEIRILDPGESYELHD